MCGNGGESVLVFGSTKETNIYNVSSTGFKLVFHVKLKCLSLLQGRFTIAAKHHMSIAEIYETELVDIDKVKKYL